LSIAPFAHLPDLARHAQGSEHSSRLGLYLPSM
jgi:hypothetical protein